MTNPKKNGESGVSCRWRKATPEDKLGLDDLRGVYFCPDCKGWTANLPAYRYDVCPAKDRRKGADRRKQWAA